MARGKRYDTPAEYRYQYRAMTHTGKTLIADSWIECVKDLAAHLGVALHDVRVLARSLSDSDMSWYVYTKEAHMIADVRSMQRTQWTAAIAREIKP